MASLWTDRRMLVSLLFVVLLAIWWTAIPCLITGTRWLAYLAQAAGTVVIFWLHSLVDRRVSRRISKKRGKARP